MALFKNRTVKWAFYGCLGFVGFLFILTFFIVPFLFHFFPSLTRSFIFVPNEEIPQNEDYKHPENSGFIGGRNFYLTTEDGATLGVWHTLPSSLEDEATNLNLTNLDNVTATQIYNDWLAEGTVFLYLHGSAGTRTSPHRLRLYRLINDLDCHIVTFDYRGYGDSSSAPTSESDLILDTTTVFDWLREKVTKGNIFIWGHSLGTGVAAHASHYLVGRGENIRGIILESPFNNMADAVRASPLTDAISFLPWFDFCFIKPLYTNDLSFESDNHLKNISTPVLILHAKDDKIVPYRLAAKLYNDVAVIRKDPNTIHIIGYNSSLGYGHYNIALDSNLNNTIRQFVEKSAN